MSNYLNSIQRNVVIPALILIAALGVRMAHAGDLVVAGYGGIWEESLRQCAIAAFEKKTGKSVDFVLGSPSQWLNQVAASPGKPPIDIMYMPPDNALDAAKRGLVDKVDAGRAPHLKEIPARFIDSVDGYGAATNYGAMGAVYNTKTVPNRPKTWKDFVEGTVAGKWKAAVPSINYVGGVYTLWMYSHLYGGSAANVAPGLAQIKRMMASGNLKLWVDPNQLLNDLKSGEVDIAMYWDGRAWAFIDSNPEFNYYTPQDSIMLAAHIQKVKGGSDLAWQFIDVAMSAEPQACFGNKMRQGVTNKNVVYDAKVKPKITDLSLVVLPPAKELALHLPQWVEQWNKEIGR